MRATDQREARRRGLFRRRRGERGQALVEFALMVPIMVLLFTAIVNVGDVLNAYLSVINASRDGARLGSRGDVSNSQIIAAVTKDLERLRAPAQPNQITISTPTVVSGQKTIKVNVCRRHELLISYPLLPIPDPIRMCGSTTMRSTKTT